MSSLDFFTFYLTTVIPSTLLNWNIDGHWIITQIKYYFFEVTEMDSSPNVFAKSAEYILGKDTKINSQTKKKQKFWASKKTVAKKEVQSAKSSRKSSFD